MSQWLQDCDDNHQRCSTIPQFVPTRLIFVGTTEDPVVQLLEMRNSTQIHKFIALSHRWGDENVHSRFCTTADTIKGHLKGIEFGNLPATFQDAVTTTRKLGIQYLWIDSICIIQQDEDDWRREAQRMEDVFSSAYCVIAASCATGTSDGFLKDPPNRDFVMVSGGYESEPPLYVCDFIDDFDQHVLQAGLNKRGWVLQERALARRTIHFAEAQTYWECGDGIRCETLTKMVK